MTLESNRGGKRTFKFSVVRDQLFTPLMTYTAIVNTLTSYERQFGNATYSINGKVQLGQATSRSPSTTFSPATIPARTPSAYVVAPLTALIGNDYEKVRHRLLDLSIKSTEEPRTATVERVWLDDPRPRAGRTVPLKVLLRTYRGEDLLRTIPIQIPANASGNLSIMVADGAAAQHHRTARSAPAAAAQRAAVDQGAQPRRASNNTLYVKLLGVRSGRGRQRRSALFAASLGARRLEADRTGGNFNPLNSATLGEW